MNMNTSLIKSEFHDIMNIEQIADEVQLFPNIHLKKNDIHLASTQTNQTNIKNKNIIENIKSNTNSLSTLPKLSSSTYSPKKRNHNKNSYVNQKSQHSVELSINSLQIQDFIPFNKSKDCNTSSKNISLSDSYTTDIPLQQLRSYLATSNKYTSLSVIIYDGWTQKDTPEYVALRKKFQHQWGPMAYIFNQLEKLLIKFQIKMAIIDGNKVYELSQLNLTSFSKEELVSCIANSQQLKHLIMRPPHQSVEELLNSSVIKIQALARQFLAKQRVKKITSKYLCIIRIQANFRRRKYRRNLEELTKNNRNSLDYDWDKLFKRLQLWWKVVNNPTNSIYSSNISSEDIESMKPMISSFKRLLIYIPSISSPEYQRLEMNNFQVLENVAITCIHELRDPDIEIIYVSPIRFTLSELEYIDKMLIILGISILPKRLHIITPELIDKLPIHLTLAQVLYCSSIALHKIKTFIKRIPNAMIIPTSPSWAEKRLSIFFNIPSLSSEPSYSVTLHSRSFIKNQLMNLSANIPIGVHDIYTCNDLYESLAKLISTNLGINRWIIKFNYDYNGDSFAIFDMKLFSITNALRREQMKILEESNGNLIGWFSRPNQFAVRKRILLALKNELHKKIAIANTKLFSTWDKYLNHCKGCVIEADPNDKVGYVDGLCFIEPNGNVKFYGSCELIVDSFNRTQAYLIPQQIIPMNVLEHATIEIASYLFQQFHVIGYVTIKFISTWDNLEKIPRLISLNVELGLTYAFSLIGNASSLYATNQINTKLLSYPSDTNVIPLDSTRKTISNSFISQFPLNCYVVGIPILYHKKLINCRDDYFFKQIGMRALLYDHEKKMGTIFNRVDSIGSGNLSTMTFVPTNRIKCLEVTLYCLMNILELYPLTVSERIQYDPNQQLDATWMNITNIIYSLKLTLKHERDSLN